MSKMEWGRRKGRLKQTLPFGLDEELDQRTVVKC